MPVLKMTDDRSHARTIFQIRLGQGVREQEILAILDPSYSLAPRHDAASNDVYA